MYGPDFAADPGSVYAWMREFGPFAPVQLAPGVDATLVTGYEAALHVLRSGDTFNKDARRWRAMNDGTVAQDSPVAGLMKYRPTTLWADGAAHRRLRSPIEEGLSRIDPDTLRGYVEQSADLMIDKFASAGRADLLAEYARELPLLVLIQLFGCTPELGDRLHTSMSELFDGIDSAKNHTLMAGEVTELIALKREQPGDDMVSRLLEHESALTDEELVHQIIMLFGAGTEPEQNLIANTLRLLLSDERFAGSLRGGSMPIEDAIDEVLWTDPPMANYGVHYTFRDVEVEGTLLREGTPIVVSFAAASNDPALATDQRSGNRAHLAWSAGPHTCPARREAGIIATVAVERLLDRLPDLELALPVEELTWRPGPFHRALTSLPVRFPPAVTSSSLLPPETAAGTSAGTTGGTSEDTVHTLTSFTLAGLRPTAYVPEPAGAPDGERRIRWGSLARWWRGE
jgi:cytochrome P450